MTYDTAPQPRYLWSWFLSQYYNQPQNYTASLNKLHICFGEKRKQSKNSTNVLSVESSKLHCTECSNIAWALWDIAIFITHTSCIKLYTPCHILQYIFIHVYIYIIINQNIHKQTILIHSKNNGEAPQVVHYDAQNYSYNATKMSKKRPYNDTTRPKWHQNNVTMPQ